MLPLESYIAYTSPVVDSVDDAERGLDVEYADAWADQIFLFLSAGKSLLSWCEQDGKPARSRVLQWMQDSDVKFDYLRTRFEKAMLNRALAAFDEAADVIDEPLVVNAKGFFDLVSAMDKKQRVDSKLRMAALLDPTKFAPLNKTAQSIQLNQVNLTKNNVVEMTDETLLRVLSEFERRKNGHPTSDPITRDPGGDGSEGTSSSPQRPQLPG
jgi:hypothetical protein